jgi:hypothetical protein
MSSASDAAPNESSVFLITTEGDRGRSLRRQSAIAVAAMFLLMGMAPGISVLVGHSHAAPRSADRAGATTDGQTAALLAVAGTACAVVIPWLIYRMSPRGVWALDSRGIEYQPLRGAPRRLAWTDVEAIHAPWALARTPPRIHTITFRSREGDLPLVLFFDNRTDVQAACAAIVGWLGDAFDLTPPVSGQLSWKRVARMTAIASAFVVAWAGLAVCLNFADPYGDYRGVRVILSILPLLFLAVPLLLLRWQSPYWRYRRSST